MSRIRFFGSAFIAGALLAAATHLLVPLRGDAADGSLSGPRPESVAAGSGSPTRPGSEPAGPGPIDPGPTGPATPEIVPAGHGKVLHLTFDDGPSPRWTPAVLDILTANGAHATFFMVGKEAAAHPDLVRAVRARGHTVGNHSFDHADLARLTDDAVTRQVSRTRAAIGPSTCTRPPYGAISPRVSSALAALGQRVQLWDIDTRDWARPGSAAIVDSVLAKARNGAVVLMHDGGSDRAQTVEALRVLLPRLTAAGWRFEPVPGC